MLIRYAEKNDMGVVALHGSTAYHRTLRNETHKRCLVFSFWSGHCYMYTDARQFTKFNIYDINEPEPQARPTLRGTIVGNTKQIHEWKPYTEPMSGYFYVPHGSLKYLREEFLKQGQCPRTSMKSIFDIKKIIVTCQGEKGPRSGVCHIYELPRYYELMRSWADTLGEERQKCYGEGLGGLTLVALEVLLRPNRAPVDMYAKFQFLRSQKL